MTIYAPTRYGSRPRLSRDEIVTRGENAALATHPPWIYHLKVKSGRRRTRNTEYQAMNLKDLFGKVVQDHARIEETLSAYAIQRVMKTNLKSFREDY